ncbi:MAG: DNA-directed RNA polymerase subunit beta [Saprospiraceae bacterium]|jgi:DNA-directed RNA polymerase subunit beta|uniref:DNA-directed RNA polymerase subunit beta n=1 Tax=Candidatus Brachybacter algidus TaxID=2982024 RepID=UPI001B628408|nr:DNA-directed RNA polymerase subunit beta [Candidatus Brachybacter algidus]MBP7305116.1 DNA-directed RNA polymerase subunit beta [Saprospiraceae bacterium]MBK6449697.1 DNA-directed RNA polymerase subunit beta [Candidatus Brachybacter algidus]MBK7604413.1 DNA-directed RNA polymerase subunit beta [Candidatus Brachybacter algidus]MBK8355422.1 DNA-directed RNA polymerase subunit beta [Candidatus Brachybacter algidus]MBK8603009.1 DNA-directed RNA polymerase subunit beta [Candidatus Brachybacter a
MGSKVASKNSELTRHNFGKIKLADHQPDLLEIQLKSFKEFFQLETTPENRINEGLYRVFQENFPISDARSIFVLEFLDYYIDPPRYDIEECMQRGLTYSLPLKAKLRLSCNDEEHVDFQTIVQDVFLGNIPYMTPKGTFVINGAQRVVVSQLHRSPGVFFSQTFHPNGTKIYSARVIPFKGAWMEFATDINTVMYAYIDRKKKFPVTTLLRAIGFGSDKDILEIFGLSEEISAKKKDLQKAVGRKLAARVLRKWTEDFVDEDTGEVVTIERNEIILERDVILEESHFDLIQDAGIETVILQKEDVSEDYTIIYNTLQKDPASSEIEAVEYIYRQLRGAEPPDEETARSIIDKLFFSDKRYNLGEVGRYKINRKLGLSTDLTTLVLTKEDIILIVKYLVSLINQKAELDDIDHLSNRRVRTVGEQLFAQFGVGLARMARTIRERMNVRDNEVFTPVDLINARTLSSVINSFFGTSQLSQFLDQTNPLSEITHKRRISALGPGGLSRERAGFEVRDVHYSHYGRLCTIETPEGPNIGLISTLCVHAKINKMGFLETPYRKVNNGVVDLTTTVDYLSAEAEDYQKIAQANSPINEDGSFVSDRIKARDQGDFPVLEPSEVEYIDVAPNQIVGISASLIPFLENDDANRALMGSNMQRQAVPLIRPASPIVGTGLEGKVARDSRMLINAEGDGVVDYVDAAKIIIRYDRSEEDQLVSFEDNVKTYTLTKFLRTNQGTCINLKPIVKKGMRVNAGTVLCEGYATENGELALGQNLKVAFMPWKGYNFEDAIVLSERVVREDVFSSIHIEHFEMDVRDTKLGEEELTPDIPNVSEEATKDLDDNGIIRVGAWVNEGDILIGKITPKGESDPTPEEKLLRAIFGDKAGDVKDASLKCPPSVEGVVINKQLFARAKKDKVQKVHEKDLLDKLDDEHEVLLNELKTNLIDKLLVLVKNRVTKGIKSIYNEEMLPKGSKFNKTVLKAIEFNTVDYANWTDDDATNALIVRMLHNYSIKVNEELGRYKREKFNISIGDELPAGVLKLAKVYIAKKRKLKVGDKLAGRHGNKGIVSRIVRVEDMPFLEDGTPVDIVLNPLGVPSRMNLGQIFETVLGWAGEKLNIKYATPIFDGAKFSEIADELVKAELPELGQTYLYDGETGDKFHQKATVGVIYMLKLSHMVDDKMHARSIGPYSLITQQPLGGKAQFGGQRFGEMEVWALEAYGASNILQELLTIKSDDIQGRAKAYEAIVKGDNLPEPNIPESFNVLVHELRGLALDVGFD